MKVSVVLCTHNRCQSLAKTLNDLAASIFSEPIEWEVLVVDNNSSDRTKAVVEDFCRQCPARFRYLFEPHQGKSHALNAGVREAHGDVLAFLDDDVTVEPMWLQNLTSALFDGQWAGSGGRTLPTEAFLPPRWLPLNSTGVICGDFDLGDIAHELDRAPYGTNMAFRKEMFEKYGLFRTDLGPSPNPAIPRPNEDTEFGRRLISAGERLRYEPLAVVRHPVVRERITKEFLLSWWFDYGRAMVREWGRGPDFLGIPRPYFSILKTFTTRLPGIAVRWMAALQPQRRFFFKSQVWKLAGEIAEFYDLARRRG